MITKAVEFNMIKQFISTCRERGDKTAFVYDGRRISYSELLRDVFKMIAFFKSKGISRENKVLLLVMPSYEFYVLLFACIYYGLNIVVMDSYNNMGRVRQTMEDNGVYHVFCNRLTSLLKCRFSKTVVFINISDYSRYPDEMTEANGDVTKTVLTTFTSGTTGKPKPIERSVADLAEQIRVVSKNIAIGDTDTVYAGLPIYALFMVYSGLTCVISKRIRKNELRGWGVTAMLAPISQLLKLKERFPFIQKLYLGGAMLYSKEARQLKETFPSAEITYIYGSSECVLMAKANLDHYLANSFALDTMIDGVQLSIVEKDAHQIGRIMAQGNVVLTADRQVVGGDIGYIDGKGLHIVGRSQYSCEGRYNYVTDDRILSANPKVRSGFSFVYQGQTYFCYQGKLSRRESDISYHKFRRLPMDPKHRTKLDYKKVIEFIERSANQKARQ